MSNNYDDYSYEDKDNNKSSIVKKALIVVLVVLAILLILYLVKSCADGRRGEVVEPQTPGFDYESALLEAGKAYFNSNLEENPNVVGECNSVELQRLIDSGLINQENFANCNTSTTYLRVCVLENGTKQYTPWLACTDKNSENEYGDLKEGNLNDVVADQTYTEFKYLPQALKKGGEQLGKVEELWKEDIKYSSYKTLAKTTYYRYRDKLYIWNVSNRDYYTTGGDKATASEVNEYYTSSPASGYNLSDSKTTEAYKWYTTTAKKEYATEANGGKSFSPNPIGDYKYNDGGADVTMYRTRTVTGTFAPKKYYVCSTNATSEYVVYQPDVECGKGANKNYTYQRDIIYSCTTSDSDSVIANKVDNEKAVCNNYSAWTTPSTAKCDTKNSATCQSVTVTFYNWYKFVDSGIRTYYPSGANSASGEKVYYTSEPVKGAIKDTATKATAYKWYKETKFTTSDYTATAPKGYTYATKTNQYKWSDWSDYSTKNPKVSDGRDRSIESKVKIKLQEIQGTNPDSWENLSEDYITESEMIQLLKDKKYDVNTLDDISNNGELNYLIKMYVRNKKESSK